jgi:hypothetical protein
MCVYPVSGAPTGRYIATGLNGTKDFHNVQPCNVLEKNVNLRQVLNAPLQVASGVPVASPALNRVPFTGGMPMIRSSVVDGMNVRLPPAYNQYRLRNTNICATVPQVPNNMTYSEMPAVGGPWPNAQSGPVGRMINQTATGCRVGPINGYTDCYVQPGVPRNGYCATPAAVMNPNPNGSYAQMPMQGWNQMQHAPMVPFCNAASVSGVNAACFASTYASPPAGSVRSIPTSV